ncbi:MAG: Hsp20/alpha crystallin family protein [Spirochaetota bacterium]
MYIDLLDDLNRIRNEMNRTFRGRLAGNYFSYPPINVYDKEDSIEIEVLIAGLTKDDIDINFENNILTISGTKKANEDDKTKYVRQEREYGDFSKSLEIGIPVDPESIKATYDKGILNIIMNKDEKAKAKKIKIQ